jgi:hypothetical protein
MRRKNLIVTAALLLAGVNSARASMSITEWMYNGLNPGPTPPGGGSFGEFVQFTNTGATSLDMTGWSFDDNSETAGSESLTAFGMVAPGESVIFTDDPVADFQSNWNLNSSVKVIGNNADNLGRSDEINLYDNTNTLIDRLTYNDQGTGAVKGPRTNNVAAYILPANENQVGPNWENASLAVLASTGDAFGSRMSTLHELANPGPVAAPEPTSIGLLAVAGIFLGRRARLRRQIA